MTAPERPSPTQLHYLIAALERGSWSGAAEHVGVSDSAFAQAMRELQRRLGVTLFDKVGRNRVPTEHAARAARHGAAVLDAYDGLTRWATQVRSGDVGTIRAGMIDTAAVHHFGEALVRFRRLHPDIGVRLTVGPSARLGEELRRGIHDVIVSVAPDDLDGILARPAVEEPLFVYGPDIADGAVSPDAWGPWVSFPEDSLTRRLVSRELARRDIAFDVVAESSQPAVIREMVRLGMGITVLPAVDAEREPHALRRVSTEPIAVRTLSVMTIADRSVPPALERFVAMLISESRIA